MGQSACIPILQLVERIMEIVHSPVCVEKGTVVQIADLLVAQVVKETFDDTKVFRWSEFEVLQRNTSPQDMAEIIQLRTVSERLWVQRCGRLRSILLMW